MFDRVQNWLGQQSTADALDPVIFFIPRAMDQAAAQMYAKQWVGQDGVATWLTGLKLAIGMALLVGAMALILKIKHDKSHHWWPLVLLALIGSLGSLAGATWGQSVMICLPDSPAYAARMPEFMMFLIH